MRLFLDWDTLDIALGVSDGSPLCELNAQYGGASPFSISFKRDLVAFTPDAGTLYFVAKATNAFDGPEWAEQATWTQSGSNFTGSVAWDSTLIAAALGVDPPDTSDDVASITIQGQFRYVTTDDVEWRSKPFTVIVRNSLDRPSDDPPAYPTTIPGMGVIYYLPSVTTPSGLTGITSLARPTGQFFAIYDTGSAVLRFYELIASMDATSLPTTARPSDYNASTNARVFRLRSVSTSGGGGTAQAGSVNVTTDAESVTVTFATAFASTPAVTGVLLAVGPSDPGVMAWPDRTSITTTGFTARLGYPAPANSVLYWGADLIS